MEVTSYSPMRPHLLSINIQHCSAFISPEKYYIKHQKLKPVLKTWIKKIKKLQCKKSASCNVSSNIRMIISLQKQPLPCMQDLHIFSFSFLIGDLCETVTKSDNQNNVLNGRLNHFSGENKLINVLKITFK